MNDFLKKLITWIFVLLTIALVSYLAYQFYNYAIRDATKRIKTGVSEGVSEGIEGGVKKGVGGMANPLTLPAKIFQGFGGGGK